MSSTLPEQDLSIKKRDQLTESKPDQQSLDLSSISASVQQNLQVDKKPKSNRLTACICNWFNHMLGDVYREDDPKKYSMTRKGFIILIVGMSGVNGPLGSQIYLPGISQLTEDFQTSLPATDATVAVYLVCLGIAPLFWASMSDVYGRKPMYIYSLIITIFASIICAISKNIPMLLIFRVLQACGSSSGQTLGAGVVADTFELSQRGRAFSIFYLGPLLAPVLSSVVGGVLTEFLGWRATFYFIAILSAILLILVVFLLPETLRKSRQLEETVEKNLEKKPQQLECLGSISQAFKPMLVMIRDPTVILATLFNTVMFASLYFLNPTISETFESVYHYNSWQIGLCYLAFAIGLIVGSVASGRYADYILKVLQEKNGPEGVYPELRIKAAYPSILLIPAGYLVYAWTTQTQAPAYAPLIGLFLYGVGQMAASTPISVYLVDSKPGRSASAVAINNCVRYVAAGITTIFSSISVRAIGPGILFTILAAINLLNMVNLLLLRFCGRKWRLAFEKKTNSHRSEKDKEDLELVAVSSRMSAL